MNQDCPPSADEKNIKNDNEEKISKKTPIIPDIKTNKSTANPILKKSPKRKLFKPKKKQKLINNEIISIDDSYDIEKTQLSSDLNKTKKRKFETDIAQEDIQPKINKIDNFITRPYWNNFTKKLSKKTPLITNKNSANVELNSISNKKNYNSWYL